MAIGKRKRGRSSTLLRKIGSLQHRLLRSLHVDRPKVDVPVNVGSNKRTKFSAWQWNLTTFCQVPLP